ncbi:MAG TPA: hypothetical protein VFS92_10805 [Planctomycetota bacterium]|nr:hypothetical protein [Planctomycetota bacterium]
MYRRIMSGRFLRLSAAAAVVLVAAGGALALAQDREEGRRGRRAKARDGRARVMKALDRLEGANEAQVREALAAAEQIARPRADLRDRAAAEFLAARRESKAAPAADRKALRARVRERVKALRTEVRGPALEAGRRVAATLTPEQRARIEAKAQARGRTVDDDRLARFFARRLGNPWAAPLLRARLAESSAPTAPAPK